MPEKVLFVDDDQKILNGFGRQFEGAFEFELANGSPAALDIFDQKGPFAVVISDLRMPVMNGIELLSKIKERSADTVRIMLTGYADLTTTIDAVNEGNIFRFLSKPCPQKVLEKAIQDGLTQYGLLTAERELLEGTLHGCIKVLSELLSIVRPLAFGRTSQVQRIALAIGRDLEMANLWDLKIAAMLFPLGCIAVSEAALECALNGQPIPEQERAAFDEHPSIADDLLKKIPRLDGVASIVAHQDSCFDRTPYASGDEIPIGARVLKVASDFEMTYKRTGDAFEALQHLNENKGTYDPKVIESLRNVLHSGLCQSSCREVSIDSLKEGMVLASDVRSTDGQLMITTGQEVTESIRRHLCRLYSNSRIEGRFVVEVLDKVTTAELATI